MITQEKLRRPLLALLLVAAVFAAVWPALGHDFVLYDDDEYIFENPVVRQGLSVSGLVWAFTREHAANWHPLTWLSHMADVSLFGLSPAGHHFVSLSLHAANAALLFFLLLPFCAGSLWSAFGVAALFALHPLHVESVAWVAERKDVLSTFFGLLAIHAYCGRHLRSRPKIGQISPGWPATIFLSLGLLAKPMLVTLPILLILLDFWPLSRLPAVNGPRRIASSLWPLAREKWILFALAAASSVVTIIAQRQGGAVQDLAAYSLPVRLANAVVAISGYLEKTVWPAGLAVIYPHPGVMPSLPRLASAIFVIVAGTVLAIRQREKRPWLLFGWLWYLVSLLPVIGIIQVGYQAMADRYTYIPLIGIFVAAVFSLREVVSRDPFRERAAIAAGLAALALLGALSFRQTGFWKDSATLFERALSVTSGNYIAHNHLGVVLLREGNLAQAQPQFDLALAIKPDHYEAWNNLGSIRLRESKLAEAEEFFRKALAIKPLFAVGLNNLGLSLHLQKRGEEAIDCFRRSLEIAPEAAATHDNLGVALLAAGEVAEALKHFDAAIRFDDSFAGAWFDRGRALLALGRKEEARQSFLLTLSKEPSFGPAKKALKELESR